MFILEYLIYSFGMVRFSLVLFELIEEYESVLKLGLIVFGGVVVIVDEFFYIELFLVEWLGFKIVGEFFMYCGWGFVSIFFN